jgi:hypothetical protein
MTSETRWHPDPHGFLDRRLRERGVSAREFLAARPGRWWEHLVREFDEPLAPVQLEAYVQAAAAKGHWLDWYARDVLHRALRRWLPNGWQFQGGEMDYPTGRALANWSATMGALGEDCQDRAREILGRLKNAKFPLGWLPSDPDDPLLVAAFEGVSFEGCG